MTKNKLQPARERSESVSTWTRRRFIRSASALIAVPPSAASSKAGSSINRRIAIAIESSGLSTDNEVHRVIEISAVEIVDSFLTGNTFHTYIDPERDIDPGAYSVHGLSEGFLRGHPKFSEIADQFLTFVRNDEIVAHRTAFHIGFLDYELARTGRTLLTSGRRKIIDTWFLAKAAFPNQRNDIDSLGCRLGIDSVATDIPEKATPVAAIYLSLNV